MGQDADGTMITSALGHLSVHASGSSGWSKHKHIPAIAENTERILYGLLAMIKSKE